MRRTIHGRQTTMRSVLSTVTLPTDDLERAVMWCTEVLGLQVEARYGELVYLATGPIRLALYPRDTLASYLGVTSMDRRSSIVLSLNLATSAAVDAMAAHAVAAGAELTREPAGFEWGGYGACIRDLDGHLWELVHAPA